MEGNGPKINKEKGAMREDEGQVDEVHLGGQPVPRVGKMEGGEWGSLR